MAKGARWGGAVGSNERRGRWERLGWSEARPGCPFIGSGGRQRRPGRAGGSGNWHLQWSRCRSEGEGRKCGRLKGVMWGPTGRVRSMAREVGGDDGET
jgi:hypothetical protein